MHVMDSFKKRVSPGLQKMIGNTGWLIADRMVHLLVGMAVGVWVARYLGPGRFGTLNYTIAFIALLSPFTNLGLQGIVVRDIVKDPRSAEETLGTAFLIRLAGGTVSFLVTLVALRITHTSDPLIIILGAIIASSLFFQSFGAIDLWFQSQVQSKYTVFAQLTALLLGAAAKVVLILAEAPLAAFAWVLAGEAAVTAAALAVAYQSSGQRISRWRASWTRAKSLLSQSWPLALASVGAILNLDIDKIMLGRMVGDSEVGVYTAAAKLSEIWYFIPIAIASSAFPALVRSAGLGHVKYAQRLQKLYDVMVWLALSVAIVVTIAAGPLVKWLYGRDYQEAASILSVHVWAGLFTFMGAVLSKWLINEGLLKFSFTRHGFGAVANIALNLYLIPKYGGLGAAIATLISYAVASWIACFTDRRTVPAGKMMALALVVPIRLLLRKL